jgi:hypothetical protein
MDSAMIQEMMEAYAQDAVDLASRNFSKHLDFSPESVQMIEEMADRLFKARAQAEPPEEQVLIFAKMLGGYIGEVYRNIKGGVWRYHEHFETIGILTEEVWIYPQAKAYHRLQNGDEDNLWHYFNWLVYPERFK